VKRSTTVTAAAAGALVLVAPVAYAAWATSGTGSASAVAGRLSKVASASAAPTAGSTTSSITVSWTPATDGVAPSGYRVERVSTPSNVVVCNVDASVRSCTSTGLAAGTSYTFRVLAVRQTWTGEHESAQAVTVVADTTPPVTSAVLTGTAGSNGWYTTSVGVALTATDSGAGATGVKEVQYSATGAGALATTVVQGASASLTVSAQGTTAVSYLARDNAGNAETAKTSSVKVDTVAPSVALGASPTGTVSGRQVALSGTASDATSGVATSALEAKASAASSYGALTNSGTLTAPAATWDTTAIANGDYQVRVAATDAAGHSSRSTERTLTVSNTPAGTAVDSANGPQGTANRIDTGDTLTFRYSTPIDPRTVVNGWDGSGTATLTVTATPGSANASDALTAGNLGSVSLAAKDWLGDTLSFSATVSRNSDGNTFTVTLGTCSTPSAKGCSFEAKTRTGTTALAWTPSASVRSTLNVAVSTSTVTQSPAKTNF
jgi:hypothetical protein